MQVENGDKVKVHCRGKLENGYVIYSTFEEKPLEFNVGSGAVLRGIEENVVGMQPGETKEVIILPEKGFGLRDDNLIRTFAKSRINDNYKIEDPYEYRDHNLGFTIKGSIVSVDRDTLTVDFNNKFAGKTTKFELKVLEIQKQ